MSKYSVTSTASVKEPCNNLSDMSTFELITQNPAVAYDLKGEVVSRFNDPVWDFSAYRDLRKNSSKSTYKVYFPTDKMSASLLLELRIIVLAIFKSEYKSSGRAAVATETMRRLRPLFNELQECNLMSVTKLNSSIGMIKYLESVKGKYSHSTLEGRFGRLNSASRLNLNGLNISLPLSRNVLNDSWASLKQLTAPYVAESSHVRQTLYIPLELHSKLLSESLEIIHDAPDVITKINRVLEKKFKQVRKSRIVAQSKYPTDVTYQAERHRVSQEKKGKFKSLKQLLIDEGLGHLASKDKNTRVYHGYISRVFAACYVIISSYTGMRFDEITSLKDDCFRCTPDDEDKYYYVRAYETKISGGADVDYITIPEVKKAIDLIKLIHRPAKKLVPSLKGNDFLLISANVSILPTFAALNPVTKSLQDLAKHIGLIVTEPALEQSKAMNRGREHIMVGSLWKLNTHQFRRTLIVNFLTHDLASAPAVKQQVKHMYQYMTEYYGKGSELAFTQRLLRDWSIMEDIANEHILVKTNIYRELYYSDCHLEGIKGKEIEAMRESAIQLTDDEIRVLIETGEWDITKTPFGYCTKAHKCEKTDTIDPSVCGETCDTTIITLKNAINWKKLYDRNIKLLRLESLEGFAGNEGMMKSQNVVALRIMKAFNLEPEVQA